MFNSPVVSAGILCFRTACADSALCPLSSEWDSHLRQSNLPASCGWTDEESQDEELSGIYAIYDEAGK